jgi:hypothetical protein
MHTELGELRESATRSQAQLEDLQGRVATHEAEIVRLAAERDGLQRQVQELTSRVAQTKVGESHRLPRNLPTGSRACVCVCVSGCAADGSSTICRGTHRGTTGANRSCGPRERRRSTALGRCRPRPHGHGHAWRALWRGREAAGRRRGCGGKSPVVGSGDCAAGVGEQVRGPADTGRHPHAAARALARPARRCTCSAAAVVAPYAPIPPRCRASTTCETLPPRRTAPAQLPPCRRRTYPSCHSPPLATTNSCITRNCTWNSPSFRR